MVVMMMVIFFELWLSSFTNQMQRLFRTMMNTTMCGVSPYFWVIFIIHEIVSVSHIFFLDILLSEAATTSKVTPVLKHVNGVWIQSPVGSFTRFVIVTWHLQETFIQTQVVSNRVLPSLFILSVVREAIHDELVDSAQRQLFLL